MAPSPKALPITGTPSVGPANGSAIPSPAPGASSSAPLEPQWIKLPGQVTAASTRAVLLEDKDGRTWQSFGTASNTIAQFSPSVPGAHLAGCVTGYEGDCPEEGVLTEPVPDHPDGLAVFTFEATKAASGLQPRSTARYLDVADAGTSFGPKLARISTAVRGFYLAPIWADNSSVTVETRSSNDHYRLYRLSFNGAVEKQVAIPGEPDGIWGFGDTTIAMGTNPCRTTIYDASLREVAAFHKCGDQLVNLSDESRPMAESSNGVGNGSVLFTAPLTDGYYVYQSDLVSQGQPYSLATGRPGPAQVVTSGPRSSIALNWQTDSFDNTVTHGLQTYSTSNWKSGFALSASRARALHAQVYGLADNDIWLTTTAQSLIVDGHTGHTLQTHWAYSPDYGGPDWTVVEPKIEPNAGEATQYLVRTSEPLATVIANGPSS